MTYFSQVALNMYRPETKKLIMSRQVAHATVLQSFAPGQLDGIDTRVLWRIDKLDKSHYLNIISPVPASLEHIVENCGWEEGGSNGSQQINYTPLLDSVQRDDSYRFSITLNPSITKTGTTKRLAIPISDVEQWAESKLNDFAKIQNIELESHTIESFKRGTGKVTLAIAKLTGILVVENPESLTGLMVNGLGKAKAYGCGMITLDSVV